MPQNWTAVVDSLKAREDLVLGPNRFLKPEIRVRPYQVLGASLLYLCKDFMLADACGLGKTLQTLLAFAMKKEREEQLQVEDRTRMIVVTEKSAVLQWADEVDKFFTGITCLPVPAGKKLAPFNKKHHKPHDYRNHLYETSEADIVTMAHKTFVQDWQKGLLKDLVRQSMLVLDESDVIRTRGTQIWDAFKEAKPVSRGLKELTATPIYTRLEDYYNLISILNPFIFGDMEIFMRHYCNTEKVPVPTKTGGVWYKDVVRSYRNLEKFHHEARHYMILRTPEDVGEELPDIIDKPIYLEMDPKQKRVYNKAADGDFNVLPGAEKPRRKTGGEMETEEEVYERLERTAESQLVTTARELQAATMPQMLGVDAPSVKFDKLLQLLQGDLYKQKVVVFSQFKTCINIIEERLAKHDIKCLRVTGDESTAQRNAAKKQFQQDGGPYVMLLTAAGKKALNLQVAGTFIFFDQPLAWGDGFQLIGRVRRIGSKYQHILIIRLMVRDTADEWVYRILSQEDDLVKKCLQVRGTMEVSSDLLEFVIQKMKEGKQVKEAMESYVKARGG